VGALSVLDRLRANLHGAAEDRFLTCISMRCAVQLSPGGSFLTDHGEAGRHKSHGAKSSRASPALPKIVRRGANRYRIVAVVAQLLP